MSNDDNKKEVNNKTTEEIDIREPEMSEIPETSESQEEEKTVIIKKPKKKHRFLTAVCVIVIAVIAAIGVNRVLDTIEYGKSSDLIFFNADGDITYVAYNNGERAEIDGKMYAQQVSIDGKTAAVLVNYDILSGGTLFYIKGNKEPVAVAENAHDFVLSDTGKVLAYYSEYDAGREIADLNVYTDGKSTAIDREAAYTGTGMLEPVMSPDGKTVIYYKKYVYTFDNLTMTSSYDTTVYISENGNPGELYGEENSGSLPVAVANDAKFIYYVVPEKNSNNLSLFVQKGGADGKITQIGQGGIQQMYFNVDYSQIVFNEGTISVISVDGNNSKQIHDSVIGGFLAPHNGQRRYKDSYGITAYGFRDFKKRFFTTGEGIFMLDKDFNRLRISTSAANAVMSSDGNRIFYIESGNLKVTSTSNPNNDRPTLVEGVSHFVLGKGDYFYYVDSKNELYRQSIRSARNKVDPVWLAANIDTNTLIASEKGLAFFLSIDNDLFAVNKTKVTRIAGSSTEVIDSVFMYHDNVFYSVKTETTEAGNMLFDVYRSNGNAKFKLFAKKVVAEATDPNFNPDDNITDDDYYDDYEEDEYDDYPVFDDDGYSDDDYDGYDGDYDY